MIFDESVCKLTVIRKKTKKKSLFYSQLSTAYPEKSALSPSVYLFSISIFNFNIDIETIYFI
jgi:hypothetical protein